VLLAALFFAIVERGIELQDEVGVRCGNGGLRTRGQALLKLLGLLGVLKNEGVDVL
jgi:hypothetical protein